MWPIRSVTVLIAVLLALPPIPAARVVAYAHGRPDLVAPLAGICRRESRCRPIGVHPGDVGLVAGDGWYGQVRLGHLRPGCQPYRPATWSTRGAWGLSAASAWPYLPACYQPVWLDLPIVSAWVATRRYLDRCERKRRRGWCHWRRFR